MKMILPIIVYKVNYDWNFKLRNQNDETMTNFEKKECRTQNIERGKRARFTLVEQALPAPDRRIISKIKFEKSNSISKMGFTLIELVVVLAVVAMIVGMSAPMAGKGVRKFEVQRCAESLGELLRYASLAVGERGTGVRVVIDIKNRSAWMEELEEGGFVKSEGDEFLTFWFGKEVLAVEVEEFESEGNLRFLEFHMSSKNLKAKVFFYGLDVAMEVSMDEGGVSVKSI